MVAVADLEISVHRGDAGYTVELRFTPTLGGAWSSLITGKQPIIQLDTHTLLQETLDSNAYGRLLTGMLFADRRIQEAFAQVRAYMEGTSGLLRLRLRLDATDDELHSIRWESLQDPLAGDHAPLSRNERILFSRYLGSADMTPVQPRRVTQPTAVIAVANPTNLANYNMASIDVQGEVDRVAKALAGFPISVVAGYGDGGRVTLPAILAALRDGVDILYLVCHGTFRDATPYLWLERADGSVDRVDGSTFVRQIRDLAMRPQLIILAACQSAGRSHHSGALASLGAQLASAGIAATIAMQDDVRMSTVATLMPVLFHELRRDGQIDRALAVARQALHGQNDWWQPVLLLRLPQLWVAPDGGALNLLPKPVCPYPGMMPFRAEDARFFCGRETEIQHMLQHLRYQRRLLVIGPSGSGKSSLVRAGLLPRLMESSLFPSDFWLVRKVRLGAQPVEALTEALGGDPSQPAHSIAALLAAHPPAQRLLLVIDPLEELFTSASRDDQRTAIRMLQALYTVEECAVILAMRADFYPDLMTSELWPIPASQRLEVAPLRGETLRLAIEQPAADVEVRLEPGLVAQLLNDAADEPGALPLLQETLVLLWGAMRGRLSTLDDYRRLGGQRSGLAVALEMKADAAVAELTTEQQALARRTFLRLIQFGEGRADTRRQQPVTALRAANDDPMLFERTLQHLVNQRLLTLSGGESDAFKKVDIAHETLIQAWPALHTWLTERRDGEQIRRRLEAKAAEWVRLERQGGLLDVAELAEAERWLAGSRADDLGVDATLPELVRASQQAIEQAEREREAIRQDQLQRAQALAEEQQRRAEAERQRAEEQAEATRRLRQRAVFLAAALMVALVAAVAAGGFGIAAQRSAKSEREQKATAVAASQRAEREATVAVARQLTTQASRDASAQPDRALLFSVEANALTSEPQAREVLLSVLAANDRLVGLMRGPGTAPLWSIAYSPDGKILATGSREGSAQLWDVAKRQPLGDALPSQAHNLSSVDFSPDGKTLAGASFDGTISLWDVATRQPLGDPFGNPSRDVLDALYNVDFSPDGKTLAVASFNGTISLWDVATRQLLGDPLEGHTWAVRGVAFSPDGKLLASGSDDGTVQLWDVATRQPLGKPLEDQTDGVGNVVFSPDGKMLAAAGSDGTIWLWNVATRQPLGNPLPRQAASLNNVVFNPNSTMLATASDDGTVLLWDVATMKPVSKPFPGPSEPVHSVTFSPDGKTVAAAYDDGTLRLWDVTMNQSFGKAFMGKTADVYNVALSPDGRTLAAVNPDTIQLWDVAKGQPLGQSLEGQTDGVGNVVFSPDSKTLAASANGTIWLWDVATGRQIDKPLQGQPTPVYSMAFSPDGKILALASEDGASDGHAGIIQLWDVTTHQPLGKPLSGHTLPVRSVAFSPDGKTLASGSSDGSVRLWDVATRQQLGDPLPGYAESRSVAFSPDGKTLAAASAKGTILLWEVATRQLLGDPLEGHTGLIFSVAFSPDSKTLASGGDDGTIWLWDVATRQLLGDPLEGHTGFVLRVAFSPDGKTLVSAGADNSIRLWETSLSSWIAHACQVAGRNLTQAEWTRFVSPDRPYHRTCPDFA